MEGEMEGEIQPRFCTDLMPFDLWYKSLELLCTVSPGLIIAGGREYSTELACVNERRMYLRNVCEAFDLAVTGLEAAEFHLSSPVGSGREAWTKFLASNTERCIRWSLNTSRFTPSKFAGVQEVWATLRGLVRLDVNVEVVPDGVKPDAEAVARCETDLINAVANLLVDNISTLEVIEWEVIDLDAFGTIRILHQSLRELTIHTSTTSSNDDWGEGMEAVEWAKLEKLEISDAYRAAISTPRLLRVLVRDGLPALYRFRVVSRYDVLGLQLFLEEKKTITWLSLILLRLGEDEVLPSCPAVETFEGRVVMVVPFLSVPQVGLKTVILHTVYRQNSQQSLSRRVAAHVSKTADMVQRERAPVLDTIVLFSLDAGDMRRLEWGEFDARSISHSTRELKEKGVELKTDDGEKVEEIIEDILAVL